MSVSHFKNLPNKWCRKTLCAKPNRHGDMTSILEFLHFSSPYFLSTTWFPASWCCGCWNHEPQMLLWPPSPPPEHIIATKTLIGLSLCAPAQPKNFTYILSSESLRTLEVGASAYPTLDRGRPETHWLQGFCLCPWLNPHFPEEQPTVGAGHPGKSSQFIKQHIIIAAERKPPIWKFPRRVPSPGEIEVEAPLGITEPSQGRYFLQKMLSLFPTTPCRNESKWSEKCDFSGFEKQNRPLSLRLCFGAFLSVFRMGIKYVKSEGKMES